MRKIGVKKKTYVWIFSLVLIVSLLYLIFEKHNDLPELIPPEGNVASIFYIGWDGGAIARRCPDFSCEISYSFQEQEELKLPYPNIEEMPEWIDISNTCNRDCFAHKSVFTLNPDTASVTSKWEDKIARIVCNSGSSGSGLLTWGEEQEIIVTAKHVIETADACRIFLPMQGYKDLNKETFHLHENYDLAIISLGNFNENVKELAKEIVPICKSGEKGEAVIVFGYPDAAKSESVTLAEGIISNVYNDQYLTDANIGPGNSGGVVIKKEENCYLGIPTSVSKGQFNLGDRIESGEIWGIILKASILNYNIHGFHL